MRSSAVLVGFLVLLGAEAANLLKTKAVSKGISAHDSKHQLSAEPKLAQVKVAASTDKALAEADKASAKTQQFNQQNPEAPDGLKEAEGGEVEAKKKRDMQIAQAKTLQEAQQKALEGYMKQREAQMKEYEEARARQDMIVNCTRVVSVFLQIVFAVAYYYLIVSKYPSLEGLLPTATSAASKLQEKNEVEALFQTSFPNCFFSFLCSAPRAAHTFHSAGVLHYWPSCILMSLLPCCTLWAVQSCSDLKEKLGGEKKSVIMGCLSSCFCSCCVIGQDAQTLDLVSGVETRFCGVEPVTPIEV